MHTFFLSRLRMELCDSFPPRCPVKASIVDKNSLSCHQRGENITLHFEYKTCIQEQISQWSIKTDFYCSCIRNTIDDCRADMYGNRTCYSAFVGVITVQFVVIVIALVLNSLVVHAFRKKPSMRKKIPNVLLFMQALVDFVNCFVYALPSPIFLIIQQRNRKVMSYMLPVEKGTLVLSASSSIWLFSMIAAERFISLYKPVWHRQNINTRKIWKIAAAALAFSVITTVVTVSTEKYHHSDMFVRLLQALLCLFFLLVTILYAWSFKIAYQSVCNQREASQDNVRLKKELRMVSLFVSMYFIFIIGLTPLLLTVAMSDEFYNVRTQLNLSIFTLTSVFNPLLTLWLKKEFRCKICRRRCINHDNGFLEMADRNVTH